MDELKSIALVLSLATSLLILEGGLRLLTPYPVTYTSNKQDHDRLGYVLSSKLADVDDLGFRNEGRTLSQADLVVVGDSHVHGTGVALGDDFPSRLAEITGRQVYSMGVGSYGIYHYAVLLDDLEHSGASDVVLGLYPANDLAGHCSISSLDSWSAFADAHALNSPPCADEPAVTPSRGKQIRNWLRDHVAVLNWLRHTLARFFETTDERLLLPANNQVRWARASKHVATTSLEAADRRAVFEDSLLILREAHRRLGAAGIGFQVLLIPSKELVLYEWALAKDWPMDSEFRAALAPQTELMERYGSFFGRQGIPFRNATPAMVVALDKAIAAERSLYRADDNGHPRAEGYEVYATVAAELLTARK